MKALLLPLVGVSAIALALPSFAQSSAGPNTMTPTSIAGQKMDFASLDADGDGRVSLSEFNSESIHRAVDGGPTNRAGEPGLGESALAGQTGRAITSGPMASGGGNSASVSAGDASPTAASGNNELFVRLDTNRDGYLTRQELDAGPSQAPSSSR